MTGTISTAETTVSRDRTGFSTVTEKIQPQQWDAFLTQSKLGQHVQSAAWSQVKSANGWSARQITVSHKGKIEGGAQMLTKSVRYLGKIGYIPKGPLLDGDDKQQAGELVARILQAMGEERVSLLLTQPPSEGVIVDQLRTHGFRPSPIEIAPSATVQVDLSADLDEILGRMSKSMRNAVRRSQKRGVKVREGSRHELETFHRLLLVTSRRRGFPPFELKYFQQMWDVLEPAGHFKLFLSEFKGEAVSSQVCIPFGDTVFTKQIGWSGKHGQVRPNEALDWFTIKWAKANGYRFYDLDGIERDVAQASLGGRPLPASVAETPTGYKLRLGGEVKLYPSAYCFFANRLVRTLYKHVGFRVARLPMVQNTAMRFRTG
jgi:lipid II:glycine glycyltransferase (peptidoglycan interpeptide bridge formation enzyme)